MAGVRDLLGLSTHLSEERLFECYLADRRGDGIAPLEADHLADCQRCSDAYAQLVCFMDEAWMLADEETSQQFPADHLQRQQQEIAHRIELLENGGRVLSFRADLAALSHSTPAMTPSLASRLASPWVVGAAAAGLLIGVAAGVILDERARPAAPAAASVTATAPAPPVASAPAQAERTEPAAAMSTDTGDDTLSEVEAALLRPRASELRAFDAFTPRSREISYRIR